MTTSQNGDNWLDDFEERAKKLEQIRKKNHVIKDGFWQIKPPIEQRKKSLTKPKP